MSSNDRGVILVVEDDPGIATLQRRRLERAGFRAEIAADVDAALARLADGGVSLVLLDYRLGETTGLDLHRRMRAEGLEAPVILVSAALEDAAVVEAMRAGVRDIVVKTPDYLDYLPEAVRGVLAQAARQVEIALPPVQRARVLIVEDEPGAAIEERLRLERTGYAVDVVMIDNALAIVTATEPALVVLCLRAPGAAAGLELYEELKARGLTVPAILVTGLADQQTVIRALRAGIRDLVPKTGDYLTYLVSAVERVISQVRIERKLAESELRLASIIGTTMDAILMCDAQSRIVLFNRAAEDMFGVAAATAFHQPITNFIPDLTLVPPAAGASMRQRRELEAVTVGRQRVPIEVTISDLLIHGQRLYTVIARDISERRRAEAELREADRRKDEFLGMLAHELRNPLAAIMNAGEVLHRTLGDVPQQKLIAVVRRQTRALARMVDDLLDVSRVTLGKIQLTREPLLLGELVSRAVDSLRQQARNADVSLTLDVDAEPLWIEGDTTRLEQVVTNLVANAIKFTPTGGTVTVTVRGESGEAVVRVRDTGVGIPASLLPRVFDLFVQGDASLDRSRSGLGIGLALVRKIVTMHGGDVTATSDGPGKGAEFAVRLPLAPEDVRPITDAPPAPAHTRPMRVLVVDDQPDIADSVAMLIETLGHSARAVYTGSEALSLSRRERPDAMVVDIGMPGMTGYELAEQIRREPSLSRLKLIALTGYGREEDQARARAAGFNLHITKPVTDAELHAALAALADP